MAVIKIMSLVVVALLVMSHGSHHAAGDAACDSQVQGLIDQCYNYVAKGSTQTTPSAACCKVAKAATFDCFCSYVTPVTEAFVDVPKAIHVVEYCGVSVPHGKKCGSVTIP